MNKKVVDNNLLVREEIRQINSRLTEMNSAYFNLCDELVHSLIELEMKMENMEALMNIDCEPKLQLV